MALTQLPAPEPDEGPSVVIDANTLTLGELEQIEDLTGRNVTAELGRGQPSARTLTALVYVFKRRSDPAFTMEQARELNISSFRVDAAQDPKGGNG